jgi:hypothetical protein
VPKPTLSESGALPSGVTFKSATGVLSGTPAAGTGGTHAITFTAHNGVGKNATQRFTLTVDQAPAITSANEKTFTVGTVGSFTVTATGFPAPTLSETGALPSGVTFNSATGVLSGTPAPGTGGTHAITITAHNGVGKNATQTFTLTVDQAPAITSANETIFTVGIAGSFTVTATGFPAPTLSETGALPSGVTFNSATGLLSGTPAAETAGTYPITITASNGVSSNATQSFTLTVNSNTSVSLPSTAQVLAAIEKVNNYWISNNTPGNANWQEATYFTGDLAAYDATVATGQTNTNYLTFAQTWATNNSYSLCGTACGEGSVSQDYQAAGEVYIRLYQLNNNAPATDIAGIGASIDGMVNSTTIIPNLEWTKPDCINMEAPSLVELGSMSYNGIPSTSYYSTMYQYYYDIKYTLGLYDSTTGLWRESSGGTPTYWSRGNGWAFAALAKILSVLPTSDPHYAEYLGDFQAMARALAALQQPGGYWNQDLEGTDEAGPESSGTSFFLYGFAWGINNGILDQDTYLPVVENAWNFLANTAIQPSGLLGYVQSYILPAAITATSTYDFGVGAFLLGARQVQLLTSNVAP